MPLSWLVINPQNAVRSWISSKSIMFISKFTENTSLHQRLGLDNLRSLFHEKILDGLTLKWCGVEE